MARRRQWPGRRVLVASGAVAALFVLPFALNLMLHWPGEVDDYWRYSRNSEAGGHSWPSVFRFVAQFWAGADLRGGLLSVGLVVAAALLALTARAPTRPLALALVGTAVLSTVLLVIYAKRGIDDLSYRYVAEFYVTARSACCSSSPSWASTGSMPGASVTGGRGRSPQGSLSACWGRRR